MTSMSRLFSLVLILAFVAFGLFFGTLNERPVEADFFFFKLQWPLALLLMSAFLGGVLLSGLLVYSAMWLGVRRRIRELKKQQQAETGKALTIADE